MSLRMFIGALVMGSALHFSIATAAETTRQLEELPDLMRREGIRRPLVVGNRVDLQALMSSASTIAQEQDPSCEPERLAEVRMIRDAIESIVGYEVLARCEDAPSPAIVLYFDVNHKYVGTLDASL